MLHEQEQSLDHVERVLQQSLGRELTAREKFYLAMAEAARANDADRSWEIQTAN